MKPNPPPDGSLFEVHDLGRFVLHSEVLPAREAVYAEPSARVGTALAARMQEAGLTRLYSHQAKAYDLAMSGKDIAISTGTNSGKTLCYNLPVLQQLASEPNAHALYLFPTKALAQDQLERLQKLAGPIARVGIYDGDTPRDKRASIRKLAHIVLTNPDMLHVGILPGHELWTKFLKSLRVIVLDEMHVYRGVFGSHMGGVMRRLLRLAEWHGARPQVIACSATIGNPEELFELLTGRKAALIEEDGSPQGQRSFVFVEPPELPNGDRMSGNATASEVAASLIESGARTLVFNRARVSAELLLSHTRRRLQLAGLNPALLESYRAGYSAKERRQIEKDLHSGALMGLSATNAMELGVDVGGLDAVVLNGYPGSVAAFRQQAGRAGRGASDGLAVLVAHEDPLEQFLIREPDRLLRSKAERATANPFNPTILAAQLRCAAYERPLAMSEIERFGPNALDVAESLDRSGELTVTNGVFYYPAFDSPASKVSLRGSDKDEVLLTVNGEELGTMEHWRALGAAHEGAVYLHRGLSYLVRSLDWERGIAALERADLPYYTQPVVQSLIETKVVVQSTVFGPVRAALCGIRVTDIVSGFQRRAVEGGALLDVEPLELPPNEYDTLAVRFDFPTLGVAEGAEPEEVAPAIHAFEHAVAAIAPLIGGCDRNDLGSAWYAVYAESLAPAVFVFDRTPGGVGLAEGLMRDALAWLSASKQALAGCGCEFGCPSCLLRSGCEVANEHLSKPGALQILGSMVR